MFKHLLAPKLYKELNRANKKIRRHLYVTYLHTKNLFYRSQNTLDINKPIILIFSEYTATHPTTTGVQRVCKETAYQLKQLGAQVILVGLCCKSKQLRQLTNTECELFTSDTKIPKHFFKYQKQLTHKVLKDICLEQSSQGIQSWLMIPELTYLSRHNALTKQLFVLAKLLKLKTGVIFHDNIPLMTKKIDDWTHKHLEYATHLGDADIIWPNSEFSASSLAGFFQYFLRLEPQQTPLIETTLLAENIEGERGSVKKNISTHNILCVGTISHRKNQITLVKAFNRYCEQHPDTKWTLTIIGQVTSQLEKEFNKITSTNPRINTQYNASYQTIKQAYNYCDFTVYPSILEGFGLPIVESLWYYRPVICANFGAMHEVAKDGGCLCIDTSNMVTLSGAIESLTLNHNLYHDKVEEILRRPIKTWIQYGMNLLHSMQNFQNRSMEVKGHGIENHHQFFENHPPLRDIEKHYQYKTRLKKHTNKSISTKFEA
jgi:glycosyltransferase involved in cell wall biosynthesis